MVVKSPFLFLNKKHCLAKAEKSSGYMLEVGARDSGNENLKGTCVCVELEGGEGLLSLHTHCGNLKIDIKTG